MTTKLASLLLIVGMFTAASAGQRVKKVCYTVYGCFTNEVPFKGLFERLPESPAAINVRFRLYSRSNEAVLQLITTANQGNFNSNRQTKVIVHGGGGAPTNQWISDLKTELLTQSDCNVLVVDWSLGADGFPFQAVGNTRLVGRIISEQLQQLGASVLDSTHCIGFSLGAHVCGFAGAWSSGQMTRITGLDPAGPVYRTKPIEARLDATDAQFVDVIHTQGPWATKYLVPSGDVDFYPNEGGVQPGCVMKRKRRSELQSYDQHREKRGFFNCSHGRAPVYFTESVNSACAFTARPCTSYAEARNASCTPCTGSACQRMGFHSDQMPARGIFHLVTNSVTPFCKA